MKILLFLIISSILSAATIEKELTYTKYTLKDEYKYGKITRKFQWDKISEYLDKLEAFQEQYTAFGSVDNYKNINGIPSPIQGKVIDPEGTPRNQAVPLYTQENMETPTKYGRDGAFVAILGRDEKFTIVKFFDSEDGMWFVPNRYVDVSPIVKFTKAIFIDRKDQNITTLEKVNGVWKVRSMNPATTGMDHPPYSAPTPLGVYLVQQKKFEMQYLKDGTGEIEGYAPYATRFTRGAHIHGVPVNLPRTEMIEYSPTLGTIPRSHMCVRNATSHAKYIYNWARINETIVFVIE